MPPIPVYGLPRTDGTLAQPRTVAEGDAAVRARLAASAPLRGAGMERRFFAAAIDGAVAYAVAASIAELRSVSMLALILLAVGAFYVLRVVTATVAGGASLGRFVVGTRAVGEDAERLDLLQLAGREAYVLFLVATLPFWILAIVRAWPSDTRIGSTVGEFSFTRAPVPQDATTGTTVATNAEIARVRAAAAARVQFALQHPQAQNAAVDASAAGAVPRVPQHDPGSILEQFLRALAIAIVIAVVFGWRMALR